MKSGKILLNRFTGFIVAAVFFAAFLCMGFSAEAGCSPKYWYDKDGLFHEQHNSHAYAKDENGVRSRQVEVVTHSWYDREGKQYGKEYGYVVINGQYLYRESVTSYDAKGWRHINIFWIYPDNSRRDKHIWFDDKGVRHEEWIK